MPTTFYVCEGGSVTNNKGRRENCVFEGRVEFDADDVRPFDDVEVTCPTCGYRTSQVVSEADLDSDIPDFEIKPSERNIF